MSEVIFIPYLLSSGNLPKLDKGFFNQQILTGETVDIPGPAAGRVRIFPGNIGVTPVSGNVPAIPFSLIDAAAGVWPLTGATAGGVGTSAAQALSPLGPGEFYRLGPSPGGASPMRISAPWFDVPSDTITLLRLRFNTTPTIVIPAPPAGFSRSFYLRDVNLSAVIGSAFQLINRDTVSTTLLYNMNGVLATRQAALASNAMASAGQPIMAVIVTDQTGDLTMNTLVAPTTTEPSLLGAYQTLPNQIA